MKLPVVRYLKRKETEEILWKGSKIWRDASLYKTRQNDEDNTQCISRSYNEVLQREKKSVTLKWGCSSAGRAPALQAGGQEFDSPHLHHHTRVCEINFLSSCTLKTKQCINKR